MQRCWRLSVLHKLQTDVFPAVGFGFFWGSTILAAGTFLCSSSSHLFSLFLTMLAGTDLCGCKGCDSDFAVVHQHRIWLIGYHCTSAAHRPCKGGMGLPGHKHICIYSVGPVLFKNTQNLKFHLCIRTWGLYDQATGLLVSTSLMTGLNPRANFIQKSKTHLRSCSVCWIFLVWERYPSSCPSGKIAGGRRH